jgi:hypothetical protein
MEELGRRKNVGEKNVEPKDVGTISTAISTNSTFHKNVVTFLEKCCKKSKRENIVQHF